MQAIKAPFQFPIVHRIHQFILQRKYECLLLSFMLLIFGDTFTGEHMMMAGNIYQNMLIGALVFYNRKVLRNIMLFLILSNIILDLFESHLGFIDVKSWHGIIYLIFFFFVAVEVYKEVLYTKTVTRELLSAALCGFVVLCLIATFLFYQIDIKMPGSFSNTGAKTATLSDLNYFSFTTLLTIGYGDITPLTLLAKRAVMFMGLAGHFYTVFITSIIIGKYLSAKRYEVK